MVSTSHRVKNTSGGECYSQPYLFDPSIETVVSPIPELNAGSNFQSVTYGNYLMERLDNNYDYWQRVTRKFTKIKFKFCSIVNSL